MWDLCGATETTVCSAAYRVSGDEEHAVPIGRPIANTAIHILDSRLRRVPGKIVVFLSGTVPEDFSPDE